MKFTILGRDNGKTRVELETGEVVEATDAELEALKSGSAELVKLPPVGGVGNDSKASHAVAVKVEETEDPEAPEAPEAPHQEPSA